MQIPTGKVEKHQRYDADANLLITNLTISNGMPVGKAAGCA